MNHPGQGKAEIRPADPDARRRLSIALAVMFILGGALTFALPGLKDTVQVWLIAEGADPVARETLLVRGAALFLAASLAAPAVYLYLLAARVDAAGEFPPPGMKLLRDARILSGDAARGRAWLLRAFAIKLALLGLATAVLTWLLAETLVR